MKFELNGNHLCDNPPDHVIIKSLKKLTLDENSFAIIFTDEMNYLQTRKSSETGFILEYQKWNLDNHYQAVNTELPLGKITNAFLSYTHNSDNWKTEIEWKKLDIEKEHQEAKKAGLVVNTKDGFIIPVKNP